MLSEARLQFRGVRCVRCGSERAVDLRGAGAELRHSLSIVMRIVAALVMA